MTKRLLIVIAGILGVAGCRTADGGVDLTYKIVTTNHDGTTNSMDLSGVLMMFGVMALFYYFGKTKVKIAGVCCFFIVLIIIMLSIRVLVPR
jgi:hypothetical protein